MVYPATDRQAGTRQQHQDEEEDDDEAKSDGGEELWCGQDTDDS